MGYLAFAGVLALLSFVVFVDLAAGLTALLSLVATAAAAGLVAGAGLAAGVAANADDMPRARPRPSAMRVMLMNGTPAWMGGMPSLPTGWATGPIGRLSRT